MKRRPTYDEIINLIPENETLTGKLPDRRATQFKASPEGSFFDGLDHLEILKEQQNRILERQMREILLKQNLGGSTYSVSRLNQQNQQMETPEAETSSSSEGLTQAQLQAQLQERAKQAIERQQQTEQAHRGLLSGRTTPIIERLFSGFSGSSRGNTPLAQPIPDRTQLFRIGGTSESEEEQMLTARGAYPSGGSSTAPTIQEPPSLPQSNLFKTDLDNTTSKEYWKNNPNLTVNDIKFQFFLRGIEVPEEREIQGELKHKGRGKARTYKSYLVDMILDTIDNGGWKIKLSNQQFKDSKQAFGK